VTAPISNRSPLVLPPLPAASSRRSIPPDADLPEELAQLAGLLAEVVILAGNSSVFPSRWQLIAELALEHDSVRAALQTERTRPAPREASTSPLSTEHIVDQLEQLHELVPDQATVGDD
jgi:hypothetical protein